MVAAANIACASASTGRGMKPPSQFGQTFRCTRSTQSPQKVRSKEQIYASGDSGGSARLQCSHEGLSSSTLG